MVAVNAKQKQDGQPLLTCLPQPCDSFDMIGAPVLEDLFLASGDIYRFNAWASSHG